MSNIDHASELPATPPLMPSTAQFNGVVQVGLAWAISMLATKAHITTPDATTLANLSYNAFIAISGLATFAWSLWSNSRSSLIASTKKAAGVAAVVAAPAIANSPKFKADPQVLTPAQAATAFAPPIATNPNVIK